MFSQEIFGETVAVLAEQALDVTGQQVNFNIDDGANGVVADYRNVCRMGMIFNSKLQPDTSLMVRLTPSTQTEPFLAT